jgi:putative ABC transport system permease protein
VALHQTQDTVAAAAALKRELAGKDVAVKTWHELDDFYDKTVELYQRQFDVLRLVVLVMVLLSVANTVNMSVFERSAEFGTMRALGNTRREVFVRIVVENAFIGLAGAVLGALLAVGLATALSFIGIPMPPPPATGSMDSPTLAKTPPSS